MGALAGIVSSLAGLVGLVCFIMVVIQMFQHGSTGIGIVCAVLFLCCGMGYLIAFVFGWIKAREWNITNLMTIWTIAVVVGIAATAVNPAPFRQLQESLQNAMPGAH